MSFHTCGIGGHAASDNSIQRRGSSRKDESEIAFNTLFSDQHSLIEEYAPSHRMKCPDLTAPAHPETVHILSVNILYVSEDSQSAAPDRRGEKKPPHNDSLVACL